MRNFFLPLLALAALVFAGCAHHPPKPSSQIYEGDGPGIHYTERQGAGGPVATDRYH